MSTAPRRPSTWTADDLADVGRALYGDRWQAAVCGILGVGSHWVQRALREPPQVVIWQSQADELLAALTARHAETAALLRRLAGKKNPPPAAP